MYGTVYGFGYLLYAPAGIRTQNLKFSGIELYPVELRGHNNKKSGEGGILFHPRPGKLGSEGNHEHPVWDEAIKVISSYEPAIVGISVLTPKVPSAFKIAEICKNINHNIVVVFGGHHPTVSPDEILLNKNVDFVVRGEGEKTFYELVENLNNPSSNNTL